MYIRQTVYEKALYFGGFGIRTHLTPRGKGIFKAWNRINVFGEDHLNNFILEF